MHKNLVFYASVPDSCTPLYFIFLIFLREVMVHGRAWRESALFIQTPFFISFLLAKLIQPAMEWNGMGLCCVCPYLEIDLERAFVPSYVGMTRQTT